MSGRRIGFLSALRRWWAVIALASGAGALLGYAYASTVAPTYEAQARVVVDARLGDLPSQQATAGLIPTYAELVRSRLLLEPAMTRLGLPLSVEELQRDVRGEAEKDTRLLAIRVRAGEPTEAVAIANAVAAELVRYVSRNQSPSSGVASSPTSQDPFRVVVGIVEPAEEAERIRPRTALTMEFGALAALFGALAACVLAEALGPRVRDEQDLALIAPEVLGSVNGGPVAGRVGGRFRASADLGRYEILAAGVARAEPGRAAAGLLVVGAQGGDGSSSVALNLAAMTARGGRRVVLLDLGGSREIPGLKRAHARSPGRRISPARFDGVTLERFRVAPDPTFVVAVRPASDSRPIQREQAAGLMELLLRDADSLIVHASSPRRPPDALVWARVVGRTLLVARRDHTKQQSVTDSLGSLEDVGAHVVGTVLHEPRRYSSPGPGLRADDQPHEPEPHQLGEGLRRTQGAPAQRDDDERGERRDGEREERRRGERELEREEGAGRHDDGDVDEEVGAPEEADAYEAKPGLLEDVVCDERPARPDRRSQGPVARDEDDVDPDVHERGEDVDRDDVAEASVDLERQAVEAERRVEVVAEREEAEVDARALVALAEERHGQRVGEREREGEEREGEDGDPDGRLPVEPVDALPVVAGEHAGRQGREEQREAGHHEQVQVRGRSDRRGRQPRRWLRRSGRAG